MWAEKKPISDHFDDHKLPVYIISSIARTVIQLLFKQTVICLDKCI